MSDHAERENQAFDLYWSDPARPSYALGKHAARAAWFRRAALEGQTDGYQRGLRNGLNRAALVARDFPASDHGNLPTDPTECAAHVAREIEGAILYGEASGGTKPADSNCPEIPDSSVPNTIEELPAVLPGHWTTPDGLEKAKEYLARHRHSLAKSDVPDFALANAIYLVDGNSFELITFQTAAKERIRWLSVHLAAARAMVAGLQGDVEYWRRGCTDNGLRVDAKSNELAELRSQLSNKEAECASLARGD